MRDSDERPEPLEFRDAVLTPLDAEGRPTGQPVHLGGGTVTLGYADEPGEMARRFRAVAESAAPVVASTAEQLAPVMAQMVDSVRPAVLRLADIFSELARTVRRALNGLDLTGDGSVRLRDGRVVPLESIRPAALSKALRGKLKARR